MGKIEEQVVVAFGSQNGLVESCFFFTVFGLLPSALAGG